LPEIRADRRAFLARTLGIAIGEPDGSGSAPADQAATT
jgi:hypothetical protein